MKSTVVETYPPAKLNLFLELLGKRSDGFHELQTVMIAIDRCDALRVRRSERGTIELVCQWSPSAAAWRQRLPTAPPETFELPPADENLVVRALRRFQKGFSVAGGFEVRLEKRIPAGAGMGGASSDAASALLAAAALCGVDRHDPKLFQIATELGSDIPFFLNAGDSHDRAAGRERPSGGAEGPFSRGGMSLARGRGERLIRLGAAPKLQFVVVYPPEPLSTARVFSHCSIPAAPRSAERWLGGWLERQEGSRSMADEPPMFNRLTEPARQISGWIDRALDSLRGVGLRGATMTGSGSACFALAGSARAARRAASLLSARGVGVCFAATPASLPATIR